MKKNIKILIAEDDAHIALALKVVLRKAVECGMTTVVSDGEQAQAALNETNYDLIISDWNMPGKTGMDLLIENRANKETKNTPFLMLTARTELSGVKEVLNHDSTDYISKPFNNDEVIKKVLKLLDDN